MEHPEPAMARCRKCGEPREFKKRCRPCRAAQLRSYITPATKERDRIRHAAYYLADRERLAAKNRERAKRDRAKSAPRQAKWREANAARERARLAADYIARKTEIAEYHATRYAAKKQQIDAYRMRWIAANKDTVAAQTHRRRTLKRNALGEWTPAEWAAKKAAFDHRCVDCGLCEGAALPDGTVMRLTVGHATPLVRGGSNFITNVIPQCRSCNSKQGTSIHASVQS